MKKSIKVIGYGLLVIGMLLVGMPVMAQQQEWKSTSTMQGAGSTLSPNITTVGASSASSIATTTDSYAPAKAPGGPKRVIGTNQDGGVTTDNSSPIGDAMLPLMLMAIAFGAYIAIRRKKAVKA